jgi:methylenetetrahydrofolate--tRNA-(uracil-5-)-methyltransferase
LLHHITGAAVAETYQPMNVNFGLFPPITGRTKKADRKRMYTDRARAALASWISPPPPPEQQQRVDSSPAAALSV